MNLIPETTANHSISNLTPAQLLIWAGQQRTPDVPLYNMAMNFTITGPVDPKSFDVAFQSVVDRCDSMRTVFHSDNGVPTRVVLPDVRATVQQIDFSGHNKPEAAMREWTQARCELNLPPARTLFETALIRLSDSKFVWYFNQHHLVSDAWSFGLIYRQVADAYAVFHDTSETVQLVPPQFENYAGSTQTSVATEHVKDYWTEQLAVSVSPPRLYGEQSSTATATTQRVTHILTSAQCESLRNLAQQPEFRLLTPHMSQYCLVATVLYAYLYRVTNQETLAVGCPAHNRPSMDLKQTVGLFIELYPQQVHAEPDDTFESLFRKVQHAAGMLLRNAQPGGCDADLHRTFNVVLNYITASFGNFAGQPMQSEWLHPGYGDPGHDLRLQVHDFDGGGTLQLHFDFCTEIFNASARSDAIHHFVRVLDAFIENPAQSIGDVDLLTGAERRRLLERPVQQNKQTTSDSGAVTLSHLFEAQVHRTPDAVAVRCGVFEVSYSELNKRVDQLTAHLQAEGLRTGDVVTLCMARSIEFVTSILAVTRLGGTWVPIDPSYPDQRVRFITDDAAAFVLLTDAANANRFGDERAICVDQINLAAIQPADTSSDSCQPDHDDPAYMIYTSGSTGQPKGVVISHRAIGHYVSWAVKKYVGNQRLAFPLFSSVSFDLTLTSIFVPLVSGGRIVVYPETGTETDLAILDVLKDNDVDVVKLTPSHLVILLNSDLSESNIRQLILGGEDLKRDVAEQTVRAFSSPVTLHNEYGPTEATVGCILHTYDRVNDTAASVPIGRPIDNMSAYVLNDHLQPCPIGVAGELFLTGAGLATGYWNRPELTAERFLENPFHPGTRMYRTGDMARIRQSGTFEYLGRRDHQVKIRGSRIEFGEVEVALLSLPAVDSCVVDIHRATGDSSPDVNYCQRCGLPSNYPDTVFDESGVCQQCTDFDAWREKADHYFKTMDDLRSLFDDSRARQTTGSQYDCLALLSGGKDSTYALCRLVEMGLKVLAFTLDNGYISHGAKDNINRVVATLNVDHVYGSTPAMNAIFVDSLKRHANVCNGCFKTIYTLSIQTAKEHRIPYIVTGLSRGQFFETRLTKELFSAPTVDVELIDLTILDARKAYHRVDDAVSQLMDVEVFNDDRIFEEVQFVDFYRFCPVELDEMLAYLDERVLWIRPGDTGRSTNCLINDVGIHFHKKRRGYHNYAFPYSWDVRMGHKTRDAARAELDDEIDEGSVLRILDEIGFDEPIESPTNIDQLVAWYVSPNEIDSQEIRAHLLKSLPRFMVPAHFVRVGQIPLTHNGKVDRKTLLAPSLELGSQSSSRIPPRTRNERILAVIWSGALRLKSVGIRDHFIDLGGDSITAIQIVGRANRAGLLITVDQLFDSECIESLAQRARESGALSAEQGLVSGDVNLTPVQHWFFEHQLVNPNYWNQSLLVRLDRDVDAAHLEASFREVITHHDALRLSFTMDELGKWHSRKEVEITHESIVESHSLAGLDSSQRTQRLHDIEVDLHSRLQLSTGALVHATLLTTDRQQQLLIAVHHLAIDAMSWPILLEDLATTYDQISTGQPVQLPRKTTSFQQWSQFVSTYADTQAAEQAEQTWPTSPALQPSKLPIDSGNVSDNIGEGKVSATLSPEDTRLLLEEIVPALRVRVHEILIAALGMRISRWTGSRSVQFDIETHGRESLSDECDLSRTVGWFTSMFPLAFSVDEGEPLQQTLVRVQSKLHGVTNNGVDFGIAKHLASDASVRHRLSAMTSEVLFNYLGAIDELVPQNSWIRYAEPLKLLRGPNAERAHLIEINAMVVNGQMQVDWTFSPTHHDQTTIQDQADALMGELRRFIDGDSVPSDVAPATDFPLANLDSKTFDKLASLLQKTDSNRGSK